MFSRLVFAFVLSVLAGPVCAAEIATTPPVTEKTVLDKIAEPPLLQMPDLSLRLLQQSQPALSADNVAQWLQWERKRMQLMNQLGMWQDIVTRCYEQDKLLTHALMDSADRYWLLTQRIQAWIELREYEQALRALQQYLWQPDATPDVIAVWRQQLVHVYLGQDQIVDAERAMRRYREDYAAQSTEAVDWKLLQAQLLMRVDRPQEAYELIRHMSQPGAMALSLLARFQAQMLTPAAVREITQKYLARPDLKDDQRVLYVYVNYRVAVAELDLPAQINTLEALLINPARQALVDAFPEARKEITADALWTAYEQYGMQVANEQQLLQGDDLAWLALAETSVDAKAKSLTAVLALRARSKILQQQAITQFAALLEKQADGIEILRTLFLRGTPLAVDTLPTILRYKLVDFALARGDLQTAARLMETLQQPPKGQDAFDWNLRRARVLILSGQYDAGAAILHDLAQQPKFSEVQLDQYLQVVFDLQTVQQHVLALQAFAALEPKELPAKNRRELTYWKA
ncbi:MAG: hypothetical protein HYZ31_05030, partial [Gammaproteobacteria bacterium]|nr:hypothetical protein [Gammaproteobacteria bacterium]